MNDDTVTDAGWQRFLTGSYTPDGNGHGEGIGTVFVGDGGKLRWTGTAADANAAPSPSYLAAHPTLPVVYAVLEYAGEVRAFHLDASGDRPDLEPMGDAWEAGEKVCHVAVDPQGRYIVVSCWGDGQVVLYELDENGALQNRHAGVAATDPYAPSAGSEEGTGADAGFDSEPHMATDLAGSEASQHRGRAEHLAPGPADASAMSTASSAMSTASTATSTDAAGAASAPASAPASDDSEPRQSRAHEALILPDGTILTTDIGLDLLREWRYRPGEGLVLENDAVLPKGSGPRHMARHSSGHVYIVTEYSIEVLVVARGERTSRFRLVSRTPAMVAARADGDAGSEISIDSTGRHVHVTVRGANVISTLDVLDGGSRLQPASDTDCGGDWPRFHLERDPWLWVTNLRSSGITTFRIGDESGMPTLVATAQVDSPTCLLPISPIMQ